MHWILLPFCFIIQLCYCNLAYNEEQGIEFFYYSIAARCENEKILNWNCRYPCQNITGMIDTRIIYDVKYNIKGFVGYQSKSNKIVAAFQGSRDLKNYLIDGVFILTRYDGCEECKVHSGFLLAYNSIKDDLIRNIQELKIKYPDGQLYFTGHSLGGAIAVIAAFQFQLNMGYKVEGLYTYGCPRVGNSNFAQKLNQLIDNIYRHVHHNDAVPHLPTRFMGYYHYSQEIWLDEEGKNYQICSKEDSEDPQCSNSVPPYKYHPNDHMHYFGTICECDAE